MTGGVSSLNRADLAQALGGNPRVVAAFEEEAASTQALTEISQSNLDATQALQDATFVTLSPNTTLTGERVLRAQNGLKFAVDSNYVTLDTTEDVAHVSGGFAVYFSATAPTTLVLPQSGVLVGRDEPQALTNKTLVAPRLSNVGDYTNDTAASAGGVPIGGVYRTGNALMVRVA